MTIDDYSGTITAFRCRQCRRKYAILSSCREYHICDKHECNKNTWGIAEIIAIGKVGHDLTEEEFLIIKHIADTDRTAGSDDQLEALYTKGYLAYKKVCSKKMLAKLTWRALGVLEVAKGKGVI